MKENSSLKRDESALTLTIELLLTFSISAVLLSIVALSFQSIVNSATEIAMYQELGGVGNDIASKIEDLDTMVEIAARSGDINEISAQIIIPGEVGGSSYTIKLESGLIKLTPEINHYIEIKIPFSPKIPVTKCNISSIDKTKVLKFNRSSGTIWFFNAGDPVPDSSPPAVTFISPSPANGSTISQTVTLKVNATDDVRVSKVEYYVNNVLAYTADYPYEWEWNTELYPGGESNIKAAAYDRSGNIAINSSMNYTVVGLAPGVVSDLNATAQTYPDILLTWTKPSGGVASYIIYRSTTSPINDSNKYGATQFGASATATSYLDSTAKSQGTKYYYKIAAINSSGFEGALSNEANATTPITGTWNSDDLETGLFTPSGGTLDKTYTFTPIFPSGTHGVEVDVAVTVVNYAVKKDPGDEDSLGVNIPTLGFDQSVVLAGSKTYWFNGTASPGNSTACNFKVQVLKNGQLDATTWDTVKVYVNYSS